MDIATFFMFLALLNEEGGDNGGGGGPSPGPSPSPTPVYPPTPGPSPGPFVPPPPGVLPQPIPHIIPIPIGPINPFPTPVKPQGLPPFPGPQWTPCATTAAVTARALYWNPILWNYASKTIRQPTAQEQLGGQWITFKAAWHPGPDGNPQGLMATEAYCLGAAPGPSPGPSPGPQPTPEHPGVNYTYTGQPQDPATQQEWASQLSGVDPDDINNAWIVRMFQWAVGLTQANYPGVDAVTPSGTDGRYGHDTNAALAKLAPAPPVSPTRPSWWGPSGTYTNPGEPGPPPGGIPNEDPVSAMKRGTLKMPTGIKLAPIRVAPAKG